ncbi:hypothetical protein NDU88_004531 [Pleurodeles waltl]|uniref:Uncharacterized protein n=1 Tax=Pleurodeles waltl TaxID=8319 RepID=A0AAV7WS54_PLEWA|nr:hypothetical protein NDU88_004531 [Pleurodeles waltl]
MSLPEKDTKSRKNKESSEEEDAKQVERTGETRRSMGEEDKRSTDDLAAFGGDDCGEPPRRSPEQMVFDRKERHGLTPHTPSNLSKEGTEVPTATARAQGHGIKQVILYSITEWHQ